MRAGMLARQWCEILEESTETTATGAIKTQYISRGRVRCYEVKSRPYTYWQEKRADERFVDWQVELLFRDRQCDDWNKVKIRYKGGLYRVMWYDVTMGQVRLLLRMDNE